MSDPPRCYTIEQAAALLQMHRVTFHRRRKQLIADGIIEELRPKIGRRPRYRADRLDAYLAGQRPVLVPTLNPRKLQRVG